MNDPLRHELEELKRRHYRLGEDMAALAGKLSRLESRLAAPEPRAAEPQPTPAAAAPATPPEAPKPVPAIPPPIPPIIQAQVAAKPGWVEPRAGTATTSPPEPAPTPEPEPAREKSFEMRLGTYWLVRIGIVMLLTGLVFFGNYAYQNFIINFGPAGKVTLLYLASAALLGAGAWWQRRAAKPSLKNYAQVLFAGGLAAVYFTTYAAHHFSHLRIITDARLDGALLLGWAGFMVWVADRKKSEVLALFAIGLAYYTSVITRVGAFTLYSNLVLTLAAVFFLVRNRWAAVSFASLLATYFAYGYWRFFDGSHWRWMSAQEGFWLGASFLIGYWLVFTAAVFLSRHEKMAGVNRGTFLTMNNSAFFGLYLLTMLQARHGEFWKFSLVYGAVLLGLAELARRALAADPPAKNAYLTQGLLLVTIGLVAKFSGLQLALLLGAESVVLLTLGSARKSLILQFSAYLTGALAVGWGIDGLGHKEAHGALLNAALGAMMAFNAFWAHRLRRESATFVRAVPSFFTILALISWLAATAAEASAKNLPLVLALEAVVLTISVHWLRVREMALFGQGYLLVAHGAWMIQFMQPGHLPAWWNPALLIALTLGMVHWWQRQTVFARATQMSGFWQGLYSLAIVAVVFYWLRPLVAPPHWLALTSLLAVGITAYGVFTRAWMLAACAQLFLLFSIGQFARQLVHARPEWYFPLVPVLALSFLSGATVRWFARRPESNPAVRESLLQAALIYRWAALIMSLGWVHIYIPAPDRIWVLALFGFLAFALAGWRRNAEALLFSAVFSLFWLGLFWTPWDTALSVSWPNLLAILALLGQQRIAKRWPDRYRLDRRILGAIILVGGLSLWVFLTRWVRINASGFYLTASWSALALALFTCGIVMRERVYRWLGLAVLAGALGRVVLFDVWRLETLYRVLSFMALGVVLLVLGFIYNKYQERIKQWL